MEVIRKSDAARRQANLADYDAFCATFQWKDAEAYRCSSRAQCHRLIPPSAD